MNHLIDQAAYMPHGYCLLWQPWLVILHAGSDLLIVASYLAIPLALIQVLRKRTDIRLRALVSLFAAFILLCGLTHLLGVVTLWVPIYIEQGLLKLATALVSATTAVVLFRLVPQLVALPSPTQLVTANERLRDEITAHEATLVRLRAARDELEAKVAERTGELTEANLRLSVSAREAVHRSRNVMAIVGSLARQTARAAPDMDAFLGAFSGRLNALARATASVLHGRSRDETALADVVREVLEPALLTFGERIAIEGPALPVRQEAAQQIGLALHELSTNAQKFGALAHEDGKIRIVWDLSGGDEPELTVRWLESWTPPAASGSGGDGSGIRANGSGFGSRLLLSVVPTMLRGTATRDIAPGQVTWTLTFPLASLRPDPIDPAEDEPAEVRHTSQVYGDMDGRAAAAG